MGKAIGIDLGTTNSVAAFKLERVEVVTADDNTPPDRKLTRSVVAHDQSNIVVGEKAYNNLLHDPENTIISIKRLMGRGFSDPAVQKQQSHYAYKIIKPESGTDNSLAVLLGGKEYQPEDISAEILKKVVQNAKCHLQKQGKAGEAIDQAVITIPAYFNDKQRHATRTAALKAGLTPLELLAEPTAAAISYSYSPDDEDAKTILVYDFGGGTFDACLVTAVGSSFIESGKAGDLWLGGDDIDSQLIKFVKEQVAKQEGISDIDSLIDKMPHYQKVRFNGELKIAVERAKIDLSSASVATIAPSTPLLDELGIAVPVEVEISRQHFEPMIAPLVERSIKICHEALHLSEHTPNDVDVVLLLGGSSQIPYVQKKVREAFGKDKVVVHPRPMYAVAEGAAIVAAGLTDKATTVARDYYIKLESDEQRYKIIDKRDMSNSNPNSLNPYDILGVSQAASKAEITKAMATAMKKKQYPVEVIAKAQKCLLKAEERIIADYLRPVLPIIKRFKHSDLSALEQPEPTLVLLAEFDGLEEAVNQAADEERIAWLALDSTEVTNEPSNQSVFTSVC
nr:Hsp70 family protein [Aliterella atlantica]